MRRRVLIVTSSYAPTMIADMHRARHLAWELPHYDWDVEILSPDASYQPPSCIDSDSMGFFPTGTSVHYVSNIHSSLSRFTPFGSVGWRALLPMARAGLCLLKRRPFDIVYISTANFPLFLLGAIWRRFTGVGFVLDLHDPCYKENQAYPMWAKPSLKHSMNHRFTRYIESVSIRAAAGLVSVSPVYITTLLQRYEKTPLHWTVAGKNAVIPFSVLQRDLTEAAKGSSKAALTGPKKQAARIVYVGAGGPVMKRSFSLLCQTLAYLRAQEPDIINNFRIELCGTMLGWKEGDPRYLTELAAMEGVGDLIHEDPRRISYRRSIELLLESNGALILGVDDEGYMPSKLFTYALSGKPLLAVLHRAGPAFAMFQEMKHLGHALWFDNAGEISVPEGARIAGDFLQEVNARKNIDRSGVLKPFTAPVEACRHADLFNACLERK